MKWKEALTQQKNTSMLIWIWMILLVLHEGFGIDPPYREVKGTTCQEIVKQPNYQAGLPCTGKDVRYHCLLNENYTKEYEVCREWKWIPKDKCAYFNTYGSGNVDERDCTSIPGLPCAAKEYNSADNTNYAVCYMKKEVTTIVPMQETSTRLDVTVDGGNATSSNSTGSNDQKGQHGGDIAAAILFGLLVPPLTVTLLILIICYKDKRMKPTQEIIPETEILLPSDIENNSGNQQNSRSDERLTATLANISETEMPPSIENTENTQREREKDVTNNSMTKCEDEEVKSSESPSEENTESTERDVRSEGHPIDRMATGGANSKDNNVSAESERRGSLSDAQELPGKEEEPGCEKEESTWEKDGNDKAADVKEGSTVENDGSEESTGDEDVREEATDKKEGTTYTSNEYKTEFVGENIRSPVESPDEDEPTDVFDDTVESLLKESVDKKDIQFCQELYEFLHEVCTKPARTLFKSVLSKHVEKSAAEILKDPSIQTELKEELPPEYHASISSQGEDNESVMILYYFLRKFLEEKDFPKSGWGKPVKNTDTGIGDDVERLCRVHSIIREIQDPGKIPVEGYERLLNIVHDAFKRLDTSGKFKDDHNKLHKKLQDIRNYDWSQKSNAFVI